MREVWSFSRPYENGGGFMLRVSAAVSQLDLLHEAGHRDVDGRSILSASLDREAVSSINADTTSVAIRLLYSVCSFAPCGLLLLWPLVTPCEAELLFSSAFTGTT